MPDFRLSYRVKEPLGAEEVQAWCTSDGATYGVHYRYEKRGDELWAVLSHVVEIMPPATPQVKRFDDQGRMPMPHASDEAEQRRKEWAELNA